MGERAYPDIGPCWRDRERLDPLEHILFEEPGAVGAGLGKAGPCLFSPNARPGIGNVPETGGLCGILRVDNRLNVGRRLEQQEASLSASFKQTVRRETGSPMSSQPGQWSGTL